MSKFSFWQCIDEKNGIWKWQYFFGEGSANSIAIQLPQKGFLVISPGSNPTPEIFDFLTSQAPLFAFLAPNEFHLLGLPDWTQAFPEVPVFASDKARKRAKKKYPAIEIQSLETLKAILPTQIEVLQPPFIRSGETIVRMKKENGKWFWYFNDMFLNISTLPKNGFMRWITRWIGAPGLHKNRFFALIFAQNKKKLKEWLLENLKSYEVDVVAFGHGEPLTEESSVRFFVDSVVAQYTTD